MSRKNLILVVEYYRIKDIMLKFTNQGFIIFIVKELKILFF